MHTRLLETRQQWYAAYLDGNVGLMDQIECDDFIVVNDHGLQEKMDQLGYVADAVGANRWYARGSRAEDITLKLVPLGDVVSIHGMGQVVGDVKQRAPLFYSELWRKIDGHWRVLSLHYTRSAAW
ncbi:nuclear transport factor 2 family protein [Billgrantia pellis]|uniref:Nuclear transport factor 2 family protein n=1 Tax=Billgrantia pellis TaxID=2606936 RepID=A0A7V7FZE3_9GAMM|nr:nuclear transport factor 2 family protein [Halomonas pellis]KAA0011948.1 nuclear transport factor 2 family protein [Halomonas pellis]